MKKILMKVFRDETWKKDVLDSKQPVLAYFELPGTPLCRKQERNIVAAEVGNKAVVGRVDVRKFPSLALRYGVGGVPTLLIFYKGILSRSFIGLIDPITLKDALGNLRRLETIGQRLIPISPARR